MMLKKIILGFFLLVSTSANATLLQMTATSSAEGELGWFVVDDTIFATDTSLVASQFYDYSFSDPLSSVAINPADVPADTGVTYFGLDSGVWTVTGGGGDSLTALDGSAVWIAMTDYLWFRGGSSYADVVWSTSEYLASVPEPGAVLLFGLGLLGIAFSRYKRV